MIISEPTRKVLDQERARLECMRTDSKSNMVHYAYLLGSLAVIDWINADERRPSDSLLWILDKDPV